MKLNNLKKICKDFITQLKEFEYKVSSRDKIWDIMFPLLNEKWHYLVIVEYDIKFYIQDMIGNSLKCLEVDDNEIKYTESLGREAFLYDEDIDQWTYLLDNAIKWLNTVERDWIIANKKVCEEYPVEYRYGIVPSSVVRASRVDYFRDLKDDLSNEEIDYFIKTVESGYYISKNYLEDQQINANFYFDCCKIAYIASVRQDETVDKKLSGREMYLSYADGRCNGLTKIDPDSIEEFQLWLDNKHPKSSIGGHPFEIKRGGNSTHIDLYIHKDKLFKREEIFLEISAEAINRLAEAVLMANALHRKKIPINIRHADSIRKRILGQDNYGIIPEYMFHAYAERHFNSDQDVFDTIHYKDLGRYKRRIKPFIAWDIMPVLKPIDKNIYEV